MTTVAIPIVTVIGIALCLVALWLDRRRRPRAGSTKPSNQDKPTRHGTYIDAYARPERPLKQGHMLPGEMDNRHIAKHMPPPYVWCPEECSHED